MEKVNTDLTRLLEIEFPIIVAPMFLVSNKLMMIEAMKHGIAGSFPSLNFRKEGELELFIDELNITKSQYTKGNYGINLIVQKSNPLYEKHLKISIDIKVPFYITSLGNPRTVIDAANTYGAKVFCDVTNLTHAEKAAKEGCHAFIAVGEGAGGHAGPNPLQVLIPALRKNFPNIPVIGAGGIASGQGLVSLLSLGSCGASIGTRFIATTEASVNNAYKNAIVKASMDDIVLTTKISGTPCTIINTAYAKEIGYEQNWLEKLL